ncbi:MAG: bacillithiol biosynthesis deacetylase BshB1 [Bacteroidia bacterium]|nr:bacillithiol biosynthesis deacetylase BshB1 [Bacteroidia bacterium]
MKLDILAFAAHPDDVELSCSGTLLRHKSLGKKIGIVDLTKGEMGTRGTPETRLREADTASKILKLDVRENLGFEDCFFINDREHRMKVVSVIRKYQPEIVLANAVADRHPDHARAAQLISESCFLAGLQKVESAFEGKAQSPWKVKALYYYIQDRYIKPDFIIDISDWYEMKMECIMAYKSQFYNPDSKEPVTPISSKEFLEFLQSRNTELGRNIGVHYGEGFTASRIPGVIDLFNLV